MGRGGNNPGSRSTARTSTLLGSGVPCCGRAASERGNRAPPRAVLAPLRPPPDSVGGAYLGKHSVNDHQHQITFNLKRSRKGGVQCHTFLSVRKTRATSISTMRTTALVSRFF